MQTRTAPWLLVVIVVAYGILGTLYAVYTPAWQVPDEPAHYNYVKYLVDTGRFPILKPGDYPHAYLEEIKQARFAPEYSVAPIRYEFHQPPLYYVLAAPVYVLFGGALVPLRLLSVALGAVLIWTAYRLILEVFPRRADVALGTAAFVAFVPMHLTLAAGVENDILAELLLALALLLAVRLWRTDASSSQAWLGLGLILGLGLVTKSTLYLPLFAVYLMVLYRAGWRLGAVVRLSVFPLLLAAPWWLRNVAIYGWPDVLGLIRHDAVVEGQLRTADYLATSGWGRLLADLGTTTFQSFWGKFGWMGVALDSRLYLALGVWSGLAAVGALMVWARAHSALRREQRWALGLLALSVLLTAGSYLGYNTQFLQHQGRYLFPALIPLGLAATVGWWEVLRRERTWPVVALLVAGIVALGAWGVWRRDLPLWPMGLLAATAVGAAVRRVLPKQWDGYLLAVPYLLLIPLDITSLFWFVVPQLSL
jgi:4-amino-4-deoxy-L-arabinose transferase-like glycosyltransferase